MDNLIGKDLGRYHILEPLGEGGMAVVYKAYDTRLETDVAVKVIRVDRFTPEALARALKRFEREAKALARLTHPNIVKVTDYGEYEGRPYLVMPFLPGGNLKQQLKERGKLNWQEAARTLIPIGRALEYAHSQGVIHRDVKPSNILITQSGEYMLTDFGVAKVIEEEATMDLTGTSMAVGTPEYMAPEQASAKTADQRADIYALGIVFYEMLTGRRPFEADTPLGVIIKQASEPLPRPRQFVSGLPDAAEKVLFKALAKKPEDRYQNMGAFVAALEGLTGGKTSQMGKQAEGRSKKEEEETRELIMPPDKKRQRKIKWGAWAVLGGLVVLVALGVALGVGLLNLGQKGLGPLAGLAAQHPAATQPLAPTSKITPIHTPTSTFGSSSSFHIGSTWKRPADGMLMMYVPAGNFLMGTDSDAYAQSDENPQHRVFLDAYWIDYSDVTNAMYALCVKAGTCQAPSQSDSRTRSSYYGNSIYENYPVVYVNWEDAQTYCQWAGARLPTEAEWEKAARGTGGGNYPWGNSSPTCDLANLTPDGSTPCMGDTSPVWLYQIGASLYGVQDMAGNVWQLVNDWYDSTYYAKSPSSNPTGPASGQYRVLRGGAWDTSESTILTTNRGKIYPTETGSSTGFRCARSLP